MSVARGLFERRVRHLGQGATASVRKRHSLRSAITGKLPALTLAAPASDGATSVIVTGSGLAGAVPPGLQFQIAGDSTVHEVSSAAKVAANLITLVLTGALTQAAVSGAAVTITRAYGDQVALMCRTEFTEADLAESVQADSRRIHLAASGITSRPEEGDVLVMANGDRETIQRVGIIDPTGADVAGYVLQVGRL